MGEMLTMVGLSAASSAASAAGNYLTVKQQADAQKEMQKEQNEWQHNENALDRAWQENTWLQHFVSENEEYARRLDLQQQNWQSQFDITNAYNSPSSQMARLRAAGINPSAMLSNSGLASLGTSGATPSGFSATAPNGVPFAGHSVSPASPPSFGGLSSQAAQFSSIAQMADSVSKLQQVGLNSERQKALLGAEVDKAISEADLTNQKAIMQRIENGVANNWLDKKSSAEYQNLINQSYAAFTSGDLNKANELVMQAQERLISLQGEIQAEKFPEELANLQALRKVYKSEETKNYAAVEVSRSQVSLNDALAKTENEIRDGKVNAQDLSNSLQAVNLALQSRENERDIKTNEAKIFSILEECRRQGLINEQESAKARLLWKDFNSYEFRTFWNDLVGRISPNVSLAP